MTGLTDYITKANWVDILTIWYVLIDDAYQQLNLSLGWRLRHPGPERTFGDSEVITVALLIETFFHVHEASGLTFIDQYHRDLFPGLIDASQFNRRRALIGVMELIRRQLTRMIPRGCRIAPRCRRVPTCAKTRVKPLSVQNIAARIVIALFNPMPASCSK